jgi:hypothetical protein
MADAQTPRAPDGEESRQQGGFGASSTSVLDAKLARRKLQQDVELLSNRVERLRQEERKAKQKVLETKLRGQEIAALQKRNEQAAQAKSLAKRMEEDQRLREVQQLRLKRVAEKEQVRRVQEEMAKARREDVQAEKQIKAENAEMVKSLKQFDVARAQKTRTEIRSHQKMVSLKFEKQREAHQEFLAQDFINMIALEDRRREEVEKEIADMEEIERKHIENLRRLQDEQRMAYDALETALANR